MQENRLNSKMKEGSMINEDAFIVVKTKQWKREKRVNGTALAQPRRDTKRKKKCSSDIIGCLVK